ncbi:MAG: S1C family serine protease, partial [Planctomycetota bacterium]
LSRAVKIYGAGGLKGLPAYGVGLLIGDGGHVVTVRSHILDADPVLVVLDDGRRFDASLVGTLDRHGLAVLAVTTDGVGLTGYDPAEFAALPPAGTPLWASGNMYRIAAGDEAVSVQRVTASYVGPLQARRGRYDVTLPDPVIVLDGVTNNPGAAGGPVFNPAGRPVALIGRELRHATTGVWVNYAVPLRQAAYDLERVLDDPSAAALPPADEPEADTGTATLEAFGLSLLPDAVRRTPAFVASVTAGSPAAVAGLRHDDLIVSVGGRTTGSVREVRQAFATAPPREPVVIAVRRGARLVTFSLERR